MPSDQYSDLVTLESDIWSRLDRAIQEPSNNWRLPVMATASGSTPFARTIVLRNVDAQAKQLRFHTDVRSPKVRHLREDQCVSLVFYDSESAMQIVIRGTATVQCKDTLATEEWEATPASSRRAYLAPHAPGTRIDQPEANLPEHVIGRVPTASELEPGKPNFAVIVVSVESIDWLRLSREGNLRAVFEYTDEPTASWLAC